MTKTASLPSRKISALIITPASKPYHSIPSYTPETPIIWRVHRPGLYDESLLGRVRASDRNQALCIAEARWPEEAPNLHVFSEAAVRRYQATLEARICRNPGRSAFHEAGHAVVANELGMTVTRVSIRPRVNCYAGRFRADVDSGGYATLAAPWRDLRSHSDRGEVENHMLFALAGPVAEFRYRGRATWQCQTDVATIDRYLSYHAPDGDTAAYLRSLKVRTRYLVDVRWTDIEAVAAVLMERKELTGRQFEALIPCTRNRARQAKEEWQRILAAAINSARKRKRVT